MAKSTKSLIDEKKLKKVKSLKVKFLIFITLMLVFASIFLFEAQIYLLINNKDINSYKTALKQEVTLHFVNVGQGDSIAIRLPDNKKLLLDAGPPESADKLIKYLDKQFFLPNEAKVFDYFITSHPDSDHIGGGVKVFQTFQVNKLLRPNIYTQAEAILLRAEYGDSYIDDKNISQTVTFQNFVEESERHSNLQTIIFNELTLPYISGETYSFTFLTPLQRTYSNFNNFSSIILFECYQTKVLFTGDAEKTVENQVIVRHGQLIKDVDILKVAHHGSNSSSTENFIDLTNPRYAIIQVGKDNIYKHPAESTLDRLASVGANVLRNDLNGNIVLGFSKTKEIYTFVTTNTFLPNSVEIWQIYFTGGVIMFYFVIFFDFKKLKI